MGQGLRDDDDITCLRAHVLQPQVGVFLWKPPVWLRLERLAIFAIFAALHPVAAEEIPRALEGRLMGAGQDCDQRNRSNSPIDHSEWLQASVVLTQQASVSRIHVREVPTPRNMSV